MDRYSLRTGHSQRGQCVIHFRKAGGGKRGRGGEKEPSQFYTDGLLCWLIKGGPLALSATSGTGKGERDWQKERQLIHGDGMSAARNTAEFAKVRIEMGSRDQCHCFSYDTGSYPAVQLSGPRQLLLENDWADGQVTSPVNGQWRPTTPGTAFLISLQMPATSVIELRAPLPHPGSPTAAHHMPGSTPGPVDLGCVLDAASPRHVCER